MKYAMTMDGKIAAYTGASRWITGEEARSHVQKAAALPDCNYGGSGHRIAG